METENPKKSEKPDKDKKQKRGYSQRAIEQSCVDINPRFEANPVIGLMYGVITHYSGDNGSIWINNEEFAEGKIIKKLSDLSMRTRKAYSLLLIPADIDQEGDNSGLVLIGIPITGNIMESKDGSANITSRGNLVHIINQTEQIISDLESIGFKGINKRDFYLAAGYSFY
jgi:hypothetical protein